MQILTCTADCMLACVSSARVSVLVLTATTLIVLPPTSGSATEAAAPISGEHTASWTVKS